MASHLDFQDENQGRDSLVQVQAALKADPAGTLIPPNPQRSPLGQVSSNLPECPIFSDRQCSNEESEAISCSVRIGIADLLGMIGQGTGLPDDPEPVSEGEDGSVTAGMAATNMILERHNGSASHQVSKAIDEAHTEAEGDQTENSSVEEVGKKGLGKARRVLTSVEEGEEKVSKEQVSDMSKRALQAGARRLQVGTETDEVASPEKEETVKRKPEQPMAWFPRAKKDSFLERKIKKMQESEGPKEHLGEAFVKKLSLVEREKAAAATAAGAALAAKKAALVEVSWCRILEAAGIPCDSAILSARAAESDAAKKAATAAALGVVLFPAVPSRSSPPLSRGNHPRGYRDVIFASTQSEADVEKEVVSAVRAALAEVKLTLAADAACQGTRTEADIGGAGGVDQEVTELASAAGQVTIGEEKGTGNAGDEGMQRVSLTVPFVPVASDNCPAFVSDVSVPQERSAMSPGKTPRTRNGEVRSPGKAGTPQRGSRFGGLLAACLSPPGKKRSGGQRYDSSSDEEGESENVNASGFEVLQSPVEQEKAVGEETAVKSARLEGTEGDQRAENTNGKQGGEGVGVLSPGAAFVSPGKPAGRYFNALDPSDSDDEGATATCTLSPSRSPLCATPFDASLGQTGTKQPGATEPGLETVSTPRKEITDGLATGEGTNGQDELVKAMSGRLAGLSAEQRAAVGGVVATRGFAGFLANSPRGTRLATQKPSGLGDDFLIRRSKMEIAKAEALEAAKTNPATCSSKDGSHVAGAKEAEPGLDQILVKRLSKLEIAKAESVAASKAEAEQSRPANGASRKGTGLVEPGLDQVLVKRMSKLERAKADAVEAAKAESGGEVKKRVTQTQNVTGSDFGRDMVKHVSRLERAKAEAVAASKLESEARSGGKISRTESGTTAEPGLDQMVKRMSKLEQAKADAAAAARSASDDRSGGKKSGTTEPGLDQVLVKRLSKLEQAQAAAKAASAAGSVPLRAESRSVDVGSHTGGLDSMVKKTSRLAREKEEARAQAADVAGGLTPTTVLSGGLIDQGFGEGFVKKMSRLEREKLAAQEGALGVLATARGTRPKQDAAAWEGQGLGVLKKHVSRLERDKLAWKEAEEAAKGR